jgi:hypothetical protein
MTYSTSPEGTSSRQKDLEHEPLSEWPSDKLLDYDRSAPDAKRGSSPILLARAGTWRSSFSRRVHAIWRDRFEAISTVMGVVLREAC